MAQRTVADEQDRPKAHCQACQPCQLGRELGRGTDTNLRCRTCRHQPRNLAAAHVDDRYDGSDAPRAGSSQHLEARRCDNWEPQGTGERLRRGDADSKTGEEPRTDVDRYGVELSWRDPRDPASVRDRGMQRLGLAPTFPAATASLSAPTREIQDAPRASRAMVR